MKGAPELATVLQELHRISGFRISLYDTSFREVTSYPRSLTGFCGLVQRTPQGKQLCLEADRRAFERVQQEDQVSIYRCPFGLFEAVAPLYQFGVLAGYLMMGQALDTWEGSPGQTERLAIPYVEDRAALKEAVNAIPTGTREKLRACFNIMTICSEYITLTNRLNLTDKRLAPAVRQYLVRNYQRKVTVEGLCAQFFCSRSTLLGAFKAAYGTTVNKYLNSLRLDQGERLLRGTSLSVGEVAGSCGFADQNYFSKVFQKKYGMSPREFRTRERDGVTAEEEDEKG